ncbi:MAG: hypothetical protein JJ975_06345 [Bacteroidia bacterium]|nr:hypothetical protein [Bacteroidia bacterium]
MKSKITVLLFAVVAFFASCDELSLINYDLDFATAEITIKATTVADTTYSLASNTLDPAKELADNGVNADNIKKATIKSVDMTLSSPDTGNFDWAKDAKVFITADGQPEMEIASVSDVPEGIDQFAIQSLDVDLIPYIKGGPFSVRLEASTDQAIPVDHKVIINMTFNVEI